RRGRRLGVTAGPGCLALRVVVGAGRRDVRPPLTGRAVATTSRSAAPQMMPAAVLDDLGIVRGGPSPP
ncbi:MAG TPA: hypothetical protein VEV39_04775, partial [Gemmatimonadales bacterium]|nr:hypothetical protein [Gemmatimonadales bacterium]